MSFFDIFLIAKLRCCSLLAADGSTLTSRSGSIWTYNRCFIDRFFPLPSRELCIVHLGALGFVPLAMGHPEVEMQDTAMSSKPDKCCIAIRRVMLAARRDRYLNGLRLRFENKLLCTACHGHDCMLFTLFRTGDIDRALPVYSTVYPMWQATAVVCRREWPVLS